ncbi:MAG: hydroxysqualene dehydroxylase HpnE [Gemmataceae bacterium]|nr:hydroxysqualene dehydroxylase HpnE [Gemmataceae bacterium]
MAERVLIIGGGLAGLAAATALAARGFRLTLLEARNRLGGRASSFQDDAAEQLIDNCQHVSMGCCTNLAHFFRTIGVGDFMAAQPALYFMTPDRRVSRFAATDWPAPLHLAASFLRAHFLSPLEKLRIAWGLWRLLRDSAGSPLTPAPSPPQGRGESLPVDADSPFADWLARHGQTPRIVARFWGLVLVSALNETPDRIGLRYARKVFLDGFLRHPRGFVVEIPKVPLGRLYGDELQHWLNRHQVEVRWRTGVKRILVEDERVGGVETRGGDSLVAEWYIVAVPDQRLLDLLPVGVVERHAYFANLKNLEHSPITSVHLWWDRPVLTLPHLVIVDGIGQWIFNRHNGGQSPSPSTPLPLKGEGRSFPRAGGQYLQVVVSAARQFRGLGHEEIGRRVVNELRRLMPAARAAQLQKCRVITENAATFSAVPGVDRWRPAQSSPLHNLFVAGDWTATDWPATMEGAVRSGYLAAEALLARCGRPENLLQADLI